ncbi:flagellar assembly protein FliH [Microbacterium sp. p3-SID336]|nr:flagellar assembly protein FliH [Microbacterium sp. p3-SID336]
MQAAAASLAAREQELEAAATTQVLRHAIELAELIVAAELTEAGAAAATAARRVLASPAAADIRTLHLHPDDLRVLEQDAALSASGFALVPDATLDRGDAVGELAHGVIDARVSHAFDRARRALDGSTT